MTEFEFLTTPSTSEILQQFKNIGPGITESKIDDDLIKELENE